MAAKDYLTHEELQHIEHCNHVLKTHLEIVNAVVNESEKLLNSYLPILGEYVAQVATVTQQMGVHVKNIYGSSKELKQATGGVQELMVFMDAIRKLDNLLTPELLEKLRRISRTDDS